MNTDNSVKMGNAIIHSVIGIFVFYIAYTLAMFIVGGIVTIILYIPLIGDLFSLILRYGDNTASSFTIVVSVIIAFFSSFIYIEHFTKNDATASRALTIWGIFMIAFNVLNLIINLFSGNALFINAIMALSGVAAFYFKN